MKKMTDWTFARRDLLKGLGVGAACLPLLNARPARAQAASRKFFLIATSEGYRMSDWAPRPGPLANQTLPFSTAPLEPHKNDVIILPDMSNPGFSGTGNGGGHGSYGSIYWGLDPGDKTSYKEPTGKTLDQVVGAGLWQGDAAAARAAQPGTRGELGPRLEPLFLAGQGAADQPHR
jgi:Protein of unknown function (DUF1552)